MGFRSFLKMVLLQLLYFLFFSIFFAVRTIWVMLNPSYFQPSVKRKFSNSEIIIGGKNSWDIQVYDPRFYAQVAFDPAIGLLEAYVDGWWSPNDFPAFFNKLVTEWSQLTKCNRVESKWRTAWRYFEETTFQIFASLDETPTFCGINLCVKFLDWSVSCKDGDGTSCCCKSTSSTEKSSSSISKRELSLNQEMENMNNHHCHEENINLEFPDHTNLPVAAPNDGSSILEDWYNLGFQDASAVEGFIQNFQKPKLQKQYGDKFYRMWQFHLHVIAAAYRLGKYQPTISKNKGHKKCTCLSARAVQ